MVSEATGCDVWGRCEDELAGVVIQWGLPAFCDAARQVDPTGMKSPAFVRAARRVLKGTDSGNPQAAERAARRRQLEGQRNQLRVYIDELEAHHATLEAGSIGFDTAELDRYRQELAACEDELAALTEGAA